MCRRSSWSEQALSAPSLPFILLREETKSMSMSYVMVSALQIDVAFV